MSRLLLLRHRRRRSSASSRSSTISQPSPRHLRRRHGARTLRSGTLTPHDAHHLFDESPRHDTHTPVQLEAGAPTKRPSPCTLPRAGVLGVRRRAHRALPPQLLVPMRPPAVPSRCSRRAAGRLTSLDLLGVVMTK
ncbi:hypothetical protein ZWY2020_045100 [Hordeum vulgare]|nr:hypothetical protein ZWY2020_045100 [Hordeum vulgare]